MRLIRPHTRKCQPAVGVVALAIGLASVHVDLAKGQSLESAVKATYLYKIAPFVTWPTTTFDGPDAPLVICVIGDDPFDGFLDRAVAGQDIEGRPILVRRLTGPDDKTPCEIAYVNGPSAWMRDVLHKLRDRPVLTVTDQASDPGIVDFVLDRGRVRFRIDDQAAAENGLTISSKLLSLALSVTPRKAVNGTS